MVKITNGKDVLEVTKGAFNSIYRHQGYQKYDPAADQQAAGNGSDQTSAAPELSEDEKFCVDLQEKPISQWNKDEVKRFAAIKEIDITGTKNANEAKELIKQALDAAKAEQE